MLQKTPDSPLDSKVIKPVNPKGKKPWILIGRTDAETEAPIFWSSDANSQLTGKVPDTGKDWGQKEKRASEDEMAGWHHQCNGPEFGQTSGDGEGQGGLACCSPGGHKESDTTGTEQQHLLSLPSSFSCCSAAKLCPTLLWPYRL